MRYADISIASISVSKADIDSNGHCVVAVMYCGDHTQPEGSYVRWNREGMFDTPRAHRLRCFRSKVQRFATYAETAPRG